MFEDAPWKIHCPYCRGEAEHLNGYKYHCWECEKKFEATPEQRRQIYSKESR